jgi:hypothetical protein
MRRNRTATANFFSDFFQTWRRRLNRPRRPNSPPRRRRSRPPPPRK